MAPKRKAPAVNDSPATKKANKSKPVRSVQDLFAKLPPSKCKATHSSPALLKERKVTTEEPWTSKYAPKTKTELAVHSKKVQVSPAQARVCN